MVTENPAKELLAFASNMNADPATIPFSGWTTIGTMTGC